jgi:RNA polymerase sigma factor (sigma-70 family)
MDDSTLVKECVKGNILAQKMLFDKFSRKMLGVCIRYTKQTDQAEDVLQDGFLKVYKNLVNFKNEGSLEGWIRKIMVNTALDHIRKNAKLVLESESDYHLSLNHQSSFIIEKLMADDLLKLIQTMPEGYRMVFNLFAIEGYSHKEIASTLGISENTSKSQYLRAREYLRVRIQKKS